MEGETKSKGQARRKKLPDHLPRENIILQPEKKCDACGGEKFRTIGNDISEIVERVPESLKVIRFIRPRCACTSCDNIVQAYAPSKVIDKGIAGPGLLAEIFVDKSAHDAERQNRLSWQNCVLTIYAGGGANRLPYRLLNRTPLAVWPP